MVYLDFHKRSVSSRMSANKEDITYRSQDKDNHSVWNRGITDGVAAPRFLSVLKPYLANYLLYKRK